MCVLWFLRGSEVQLRGSGLEIMYLEIMYLPIISDCRYDKMIRFHALTRLATPHNTAILDPPHPDITSYHICLSVCRVAGCWVRQYQAYYYQYKAYYYKADVRDLGRAFLCLSVCQRNFHVAAGGVWFPPSASSEVPLRR